MKSTSPRKNYAPCRKVCRCEMLYDGVVSKQFLEMLYGVVEAVAEQFFEMLYMGWLEHGQKGRAPKAVAWAINCCQSSTKTLLFHKIHTRRELFRQQSSKDQRTQEI